jgi:hypothetical protein
MLPLQKNRIERVNVDFKFYDLSEKLNFSPNKNILKRVITYSKYNRTNYYYSLLNELSNKNLPSELEGISIDEYEFLDISKANFLKINVNSKRLGDFFATKQEVHTKIHSESCNCSADNCNWSDCFLECTNLSWDVLYPSDQPRSIKSQFNCYAS